MSDLEFASVGEAVNAYGVSAEFYDLLQGERDHRRARERFAAAARRARTGVVEVGAGTGIVTAVLVRSAIAPVHAVEPARAMRAQLLARIARLPARQRARVTVHPRTVQDCRLHRAADLAIAANVIPCLPPSDRRATWRAIADALVPGGLLLFDPPPEHPVDGPERRVLPDVRVGPDRYGAHVVTTSRGEVRQLRFTYRVHRGGHLIREEHEDFLLWPAQSAVITEELLEAGLSPTPAPHRALRAALRRT